MGTRARRQREFESREQAILQTARELVQHDGLLNLQMSRVADKCQYSVGTLYQHFGSKEDLLVALVTENLQHNAELFGCAAHWPASTRDRMLAICVADTVFIQNNPEHFRLAQYVFCEVVWNAASRERRDAAMAAGAPIRDTVIGIVESAVTAGDLQLRGMSAGEVTASFGCLLSGFQSFAHAQGLLEHFAVGNPWRLICRQMQTMLDGLGWKPLSDSAAPESLDDLIQRIRHEVFHDVCRSS